MVERWYPRVAERAHHCCEYCKAPEWIFNHRFEVDHVLPVHWGGRTIRGNLALACRSCNEAKSDHLGITHPELGYPIWLYNPRVDVWEDHFLIDIATGRIEGLTDKGMVTIELLKINHLLALIVRQQWIALGLIP